MYTLVPSDTLRPNREKVEAMQERLAIDQPETEWVLVHTLETSAPPACLEYLYSLAATLLGATGANPLTLELKVEKMDGSTQTIPATQVMQQARDFIDSIQGTMQ